MTVEQYLINKGLKVWEKGNKKRIYIDDLSVVGIEEVTANPKHFRSATFYYDCLEDEFRFSTSDSGKETLRELVQKIKKDAAETKEEVTEKKEAKIAVNELTMKDLNRMKENTSGRMVKIYVAGRARAVRNLHIAVNKRFENNEIDGISNFAWDDKGNYFETSPQLEDVLKEAILAEGGEILQ